MIVRCGDDHSAGLLYMKYCAVAKIIRLERRHITGLQACTRKKPDCQWLFVSVCQRASVSHQCGYLFSRSIAWDRYTVEANATHAAVLEKCPDIVVTCSCSRRHPNIFEAGQHETGKAN